MVSRVGLIAVRESPLQAVRGASTRVDFSGLRAKRSAWWSQGDGGGCLSIEREEASSTDALFAIGDASATIRGVTSRGAPEAWRALSEFSAL